MINPVCKIAFVSPHCVLDHTNGAATATRDGLRMLAEQGFDCKAFCGTRLDDAEEGLLQESLSRRRVWYEVKKAKIGPYDGRLIFAVDGGLPVTAFENASTRGGWLSGREAEAFLTGCELFLRRNRPNLVWTYGGDPVSIAVQHLAKRLGIPVLFTLYNFAYHDRSPFEAVDCIAVPCEFSRQHYKEALGLDCKVLPVVVNWRAAQRHEDPGGTRQGLAHPTISPPANTVGSIARRYVTFINPQDTKGVYIFARIAQELARRRPDIPILVTQGRSRSDALREPALGLASHLAGQFPIETRSDGRNITTMPFTPDPQAFYPTVYSMTKLLLMPSLWNESFGLVAAEAMLNGIPVLASNRGALPETIGIGPHPNPLPFSREPETGEGTGSPHPGPLPVGEGTSAGGFLFEIPAKYTPETRELPTAEEVEPWVETIIRLWDDRAYYEHWSQAAHARAQQWHPDRLAPIYRDFFSSITHQPGPPLVPREDVA